MSARQASENTNVFSDTFNIDYTATLDMLMQSQYKSSQEAGMRFNIWMNRFTTKDIKDTQQLH